MKFIARALRKFGEDEIFGYALIDPTHISSGNPVSGYCKALARMAECYVDPLELQTSFERYNNYLFSDLSKLEMWCAIYGHEHEDLKDEILYPEYDPSDYYDQQVIEGLFDQYEGQFGDDGPEASSIKNETFKSNSDEENLKERYVIKEAWVLSSEGKKLRSMGFWVLTDEEVDTDDIDGILSGISVDVLKKFDSLEEAKLWCEVSSLDFRVAEEDEFAVGDQEVDIDSLLADLEA